MSGTRRRAILQAAAHDAELVAELPPVVAAGFGVLALRRLGDVLTVACFPRANRHALRLLRDVLGVEVVATPFEDRALHEAIHQAYFAADEEASVNFPTFLAADFLEDPASAAALRQEKREAAGAVADLLPADTLALVTLSYRARLGNLDAEGRGAALPDPRRTRLDLGDLDLGWQRRGGRDHLHLRDGLPDGARAVVTQFRTSEYRHMHGGGQVSEHQVCTEVVEALPLMLHPTEVQLTRLEEDGALGFHVYDRCQRVAPGRPARLSLEYYFLSNGNRMHRQLEVDVHEVSTAERAAVEVHPEPAPWGGLELARWFGLPAPRSAGRTGA